MIDKNRYIITDHAITRIQQRVKKQKLYRHIARLAWIEGRHLKEKEIKQQFLKWANSSMEERILGEYRVFCGTLFVFVRKGRQIILTTVIPK